MSHPPLHLATIGSKSYLAHARVLADSFLDVHPESQVFLLLIDRTDGFFETSKERFTVVEVEELRDEIPEFRSFLFQYSLMELATAVKPFFLEHLFLRLE